MPKYKSHAKIPSFPLLKRLFLHEFKQSGDKYLKTEEEFTYEYTYGYKFDARDVRLSLDDLVKKEIITRIQQPDKVTLYGISAKGIYYRDHVIDQYIYHELVLEDTLVPNELSTKFSLFNYDPYKDNKRYFFKKTAMVEEFIIYLESEENEWLKKIGKKTWAHGYKIFPDLSNTIQHQADVIKSHFN